MCFWRGSETAAVQTPERETIAVKSQPARVEHLILVHSCSASAAYPPHSRGLHNSSVSRGPNECYVILCNVRAQSNTIFMRTTPPYIWMCTFLYPFFFCSSRSFLPFGFNLEMYGAYVCSNIRAHNRIHVCVYANGMLGETRAHRAKRVPSAKNCRATLLIRGLLMLKNSAKDNKL